MEDETDEGLSDQLVLGAAVTVTNIIVVTLAAFVYTGATTPDDGVRMDQGRAEVLTAALLAACFAWMTAGLYFMRHRGTGLVVLAGVALIAVVLSVMLTGALSLANECNAETGFPFDASC